MNHQRESSESYQSSGILWIIVIVGIIGNRINTRFSACARYGACAPYMAQLRHIWRISLKHHVSLKTFIIWVSCFFAMEASELALHQCAQCLEKTMATLGKKIFEKRVFFSHIWRTFAPNLVLRGNPPKLSRVAGGRLVPSQGHSEGKGTIGPLFTSWRNDKEEGETEVERKLQCKAPAAPSKALKARLRWPKASSVVTCEYWYSSRRRNRS
jgi:hypothetical protein